MTDIIEVDGEEILERPGEGYPFFTLRDAYIRVGWDYIGIGATLECNDTRATYPAYGYNAHEFLSDAFAGGIIMNDYAYNKGVVAKHYTEDDMEDAIALAMNNIFSTTL